jgi:hypothetical protein
MLLPAILNAPDGLFFMADHSNSTPAAYTDERDSARGQIAAQDAGNTGLREAGD